MDQLISRFPDQLEEAIGIATSLKLSDPPHQVTHVHVAGLGGSGIGADFASSFVSQSCLVPITVSKGYNIPACVGKHTLAIASSYSGNTEETINSYNQMKKAGAEIVVVSSGGKLAEMAKEDGNEWVPVPGNWPSPRACLGYSIVLQLAVLCEKGLISREYLKRFEETATKLREQKDEIITKAKNIASFLPGKTPVIYATRYLAPVALRFRQQINENAKSLCWHHIIPEMNHNELVGWRDERPDLAVIALRSNYDLQRNAVRFDINKEIISKLAGSWIEIYGKGDNQVEQAMYLVHLTDYVSYYLAEARNMDSVEVNVIDYLKGELAKQ
jgi:glucose/mannose-6-phosphate isomerase